jgi:hypothetical protein
MLTAYDATFAAVADAAGVECILVGDSLGMVCQGLHSTAGVTFQAAEGGEEDIRLRGFSLAVIEPTLVFSALDNFFGGTGSGMPVGPAGPGVAPASVFYCTTVVVPVHWQSECQCSAVPA